MPQYSWLTLADARQQLAMRLADPLEEFWTAAEKTLYIQEALRTWNALTFTWKTSFTFTVAAASRPTWYSLGALAGSPRLRSVTDTALYTVMEYHLLEAPTGGTWTGTSQFSIADIAQALQRCQQEAIQSSNCNQANPAVIPTTPGNRTISLPDTFLDVARVRWLPQAGSPVTLMKNDDTGFSFYQSDYLQEPNATPSQYNIASLPPLSLEVDVPPVYEGNYDLIALEAAPALAPPASTQLGIPDDLAWVIKWGALADILGRESEATDLLRAEYCQKRYGDGLLLLAGTPWILQAQINGVSASLVSVSAMDYYNENWDSQPPDYQSVVISGTDFFTVVPDPDNAISVTLNVLGNAPVPSADGDFIQCSRDAWERVLDYAQFLAAFKQGGQEFTQAEELEKKFMASAVNINGHLQKLGLFANVYDAEGTREARMQERFTKNED